MPRGLVTDAEAASITDRAPDVPGGRSVVGADPRADVIVGVALASWQVRCHHPHPRIRDPHRPWRLAREPGPGRPAPGADHRRCGDARGSRRGGTLSHEIHRGLAVRRQPLDPFAFATAAVVLAVAVLLASWLPRVAPAKIDPMVALRYE